MNVRERARAILREVLWQVHNRCLHWWVVLGEPRRGKRRLADEPTYYYTVQFMGADGTEVDPPAEIPVAEPQYTTITLPPVPQGATGWQLYAGIGEPVYLDPATWERARG